MYMEVKTKLLESSSKQEPSFQSLGSQGGVSAKLLSMSILCIYSGIRRKTTERTHGRTERCTHVRWIYAKTSFIT